MGNATFKQNQFLYSLTLLRFWQPEQNPVPTLKEAEKLISSILSYLDNGTPSKEDIVTMVQRWFPSWDGESLKKRYFKKNGQQQHSSSSSSSSSNGHNSQQQEEKPITPKQEEKPVEKPFIPTNEPTIDAMKIRIESGLRNLWLVGPAGCGKTTLCKILGNAMNLPVTIISCNAGTSAGEFQGFRFPEPSPSAFSLAIQNPGIVVLDEWTTLDPQVAAVLNACLANDSIQSVVGYVQRHPDCIIIATSNTFGTGADRLYVANNQLDIASLDRFAGGIIPVSYNEAYEYSIGNPEVVSFVHSLRMKVEANKLRRVFSTRSIISGSKLYSSGLWKQAILTGIPTEELRLLGC